MMATDLIEKIRETARDLLRQNRVEVVIGFEVGSLPLHSTPCFVRREEAVERLVWDSFCENNLAKYLTGRKEKVAIVAKGCDSRAVVELIKENQIPREQVVIIGVPCRGMVDRKQVEAHLGRRAISEVEEDNDRLILKGASLEETLNRNEYLHAACKACVHPNPVIYDFMIGEAVAESTVDPPQEVARFENQSAGERWQYLSAEFSKCIRCYACRNACPLCYCQQCFVDRSRPQWVGKTTGASDTAIFHIMRAFDLAGRCVECGACERACPMDVDIRKLNTKLAQDVNNLFSYQSGMSLEELAPLATFRPDDPDEFMLNP